MFESDVSFTGKYQTDLETYIIVQCGTHVFSKKLQKKIVWVAPYIAQAILENSDEIEYPSIVETDDMFSLRVSGNHVGISVFSRKDPIEKPEIAFSYSYYDTHDAH